MILAMYALQRATTIVVHYEKNKVWSYISIKNLGQIVCDGLHVLGLYVFIYMLYIFHKQIWWTWEGKSVETALGKWSIMPCHGLGENVKPGADALKQTLKAITYVICMMQHNASALTWYAVHQQVSPKRPHVTISPFYVRRVTKVSSGTDAWTVWLMPAEGVIYATGSLPVERCLWNPKIRPTQVPAHTQN